MTTTAPVSTADDDLDIRQVEQADLLAVFRIEKACFPQPWPFSSFERFLGDPGFLVATRGDAVVGYIVSDVTQRHGRNLGHVKDLAVHPEVQGQGVGRRLLHRAILTLAIHGASVVKLEVREDNDPARSLYDGAGFEAVRRIPGYYEDGEAALVMRIAVSDWQRQWRAALGDAATE